MKKLARLKDLQAEIDKLRGQLEISAPDEVIYLAPLDPLTDEFVVVEADGFGGAEVSVVEGLFPIDYLVKDAKKFRLEGLAVASAKRISSQAEKVSS